MANRWGEKQQHLNSEFEGDFLKQKHPTEGKQLAKGQASKNGYDSMNRKPWKGSRGVLPNGSYEDWERDSFRVMVTTVGKHLNLLLDNVVCIPHTDCKKSETITRVGTKVKIIFIIQLKPKALYTPCNTSNLRNKKQRNHDFTLHECTFPKNSLHFEGQHFSQKGNSKGLVLENTNKRSLNPFASACFYICPTQFRGVQKGSVLNYWPKSPDKLWIVDC